MRIGVAYESLSTLIPPERLRALAALGYDHCTIMHDLSNSWPSEAIGITHDLLDHNINAVLAAGIDCGVRLMPWLPPHMAEGSAAYTEYATAKDPSIFDRPLPKRDTVKLYQLVRAVVEHCGGRVRWWQLGNEPTGYTYNPAIHSKVQPFDPAPALKLYDREVLAPMMRAILSADWAAKIVAPEADGADGLNRLLVMDRERPLDDRYNIISFHEYEGIEHLKSEMQPWYEYHAHGRQLWISEAGRVDLLDFTRRVVMELPRIPIFGISHYVNREGMFVGDQFFEPGTWTDNTLVPNERGGEFRELMTRVRPSRRRSG